MSISYPLAIAEFWELCHFTEFQWEPVRYEGMQQLASGQIIVVQRGKPKWGGSGSLRPELIPKGLELMAKFGWLRGSLGTFGAYDQRRPYPKKDPTGSIVAASSPTISEIHVDKDMVRFNNLPNGYELTVGDYFSVGYGAGGMYRYLDRLMESAVATGGSTSLIRVEMGVPAGVSVGNAVDFAKPRAFCRLVPGGLKPISSQAYTSGGASLQWIQEY